MTMTSTVVFGQCMVSPYHNGPPNFLSRRTYPVSLFMGLLVAWKRVWDSVLTLGCSTRRGVVCNQSLCNAAVIGKCLRSSSKNPCLIERIEDGIEPMEGCFLWHVAHIGGNTPSSSWRKTEFAIKTLDKNTMSCPPREK